MIHRDHPGLLVGAAASSARSSSASARTRRSSRRTPQPSSRETREVHFPDDGDIVAITPDGARFLRAEDGSAVEHELDRARLGRRERREGRLRDLHAEGDLRAARRRRRDDRRPRAPRAGSSSRVSARRRRAEGAAPDRHPLERHRLPRRCRGAVRDRGVGARAGRARHRLRVDLPQPGARREHAGDRDLPVGRDARHDRGA